MALNAACAFSRRCEPSCWPIAGVWHRSASEGGQPGALGCNWVERQIGNVVQRYEFGATQEVQMAAGDVFVIQTPGGGGYGAV